MSRVGRVVSFIRRHYGLAVSQLTATEPTDAQEGDLWVDISTPSSPALMIFDGTDWQATGGGSDFDGAYASLSGIPSTFAPAAHKTAHEDNGADEISVQGLAGLLVTAQTPAAHSQAYSTLTDVPSTFAPAAHASSHQNSGGDEVATATPAANSIPKTGALATLAAGWIPAHGATVWQRIYSTTIATHVTTHSITGLSGDVDLQYLILIRGVQDVTGSPVLYVRPNGDTTASAYGSQFASATGVSLAAANAGTTDPGLLLLHIGTAIGRQGHAQAILFAKSGFMRSMTSVYVSNMQATTFAAASLVTAGSGWFNTGTNITSLDIFSTVTNGIGVGTDIEVWALRAI